MNSEIKQKVKKTSELMKKLQGIMIEKKRIIMLINVLDSYDLIKLEQELEELSVVEDGLRKEIKSLQYIEEENG